MRILAQGLLNQIDLFIHADYVASTPTMGEQMLDQPVVFVILGIIFLVWLGFIGFLMWRFWKKANVAEG